MTVGKIYAGLLIAENWKAFKANKGAGGDGTATVRHYSLNVADIIVLVI